MVISKSVFKENLYLKFVKIQIKNDAETLRQLLKMYGKSSIFMMGILSYLALFATSNKEFIIKTLGPIDLPSVSPIPHDEIRNKLKLFSQKYSKEKSKVTETDERQNDIFNEKIEIPWMYSKDTNNNLGIFCTEEGEIIGNTQYIYLVLQDKNLTRELTNVDETADLVKSLTSAINGVCEGLRKIEIKPTISQKEISTKYMVKDINTRCYENTILNRTNGKDIFLILLHILTSINFVCHIIHKNVPRENTWQMRIKYITLYYSIQSLKALLMHHCGILTRDECQRIEGLIAETKQLFDAQFRNCMMHYSIEKDGDFIISEKYQDLHKPFFGLIESRFDGASYTNYSKRLNKSIFDVSTILTEILSLNLSDLKPFA